MGRFSFDGLGGGDGHVNRFGLLHPNQRIGYISVRGEGSGADHARGIYGIGNGVTGFPNPVLGPNNVDGAGIGRHVGDVISGNQGANHARLDFNAASGAAVETDPHLGRLNLYHIDRIREMNLLGSQVEGALAGVRSRQIHDGLHIGWRQPANGSLRATHPDFYLGRPFNAHLQIFRRVVELQGGRDDSFDRGIVSDSPPQQERQRQRHQLQPQIVEDVLAKEVAHS